MAQAVRERLGEILKVRQLRRTLLFFYGPLALSVLLGQQLTSIGKVQLFEYQDAAIFRVVCCEPEYCGLMALTRSIGAVRERADERTLTQHHETEKRNGCWTNDNWLRIGDGDDLSASSTFAPVPLPLIMVASNRGVSVQRRLVPPTWVSNAQEPAQAPEPRTVCVSISGTSAGLGPIAAADLQPRTLELIRAALNLRPDRYERLIHDEKPAAQLG
jgi:hypothetical protein